MASAPGFGASNVPQSVGISLVRAIVHEFERTGRDAIELLDDARIERQLLDDPWARLDLERYRVLQRLALDRSEDPAFGLTLGEHASLASFGLVGHMVSHCRSIREALDLCSAYYKLVADADAPRLTVTGNRAQLTYEFLRSSDPMCNRMRAEFGLTRLLHTARALLGTAVEADEVCFEHAEPAYIAAYRKLFGRAARFGQRRTSLTFPAPVLDVRLVHHDENVLRVLRDQANQMLSALECKEGVAQKVRRALISSPGEPATAEALARRIGISPRSLRRQLRLEGQSLQQVVSGAMCDVACSMLRDSGKTLQETAYRLGFSEPSAFHRAFKRWTGMTPLEWRKSRASDSGT
jgi:AraC-like DNA-binding protein